MVKKKTLAIGTLGFLLIAGVIVVIVLAALGYFNRKGGSSSAIFKPQFHVGIQKTHLLQPGSVEITNTRNIGDGFAFNVKEPCMIGPATPQCSSTMEVTFKYKGGSTQTFKGDLTGFWENMVYYQYDCNQYENHGQSNSCPYVTEYPESMSMIAYNEVNGIKGPITGPIPISVPGSI